MFGVDRSRLLGDFPVAGQGLTPNDLFIFFTAMGKKEKKSKTAEQKAQKAAKQNKKATQKVKKARSKNDDNEDVDLQAVLDEYSKQVSVLYKLLFIIAVSPGGI